MSYDVSKDVGLRKITERIKESLQQFADEIGPRTCPHGDWFECEEEDCTYDKTTSSGPQLLIHLVVGCGLMDATTGKMSMTVLAPTDQPDYITVGLLHEAINPK